MTRIFYSLIQKQQKINKKQLHLKLAKFFIKLPVNIHLVELSEEVGGVNLSSLQGRGIHKTQINSNQHRKFHDDFQSNGQIRSEQDLAGFIIECTNNQQKSFDPVIQYNKSVEYFDTIYHPSDENIFKIIMQISRFLKQYSSFETWRTPTFRHPKIIGKEKQIEQVGLLGQFNKYNLFLNNSKMISQKDQVVRQFEQLSQTQLLNIDITHNRQKFREKYAEEISSYLQHKYNHPNFIQLYQYQEIFDIKKFIQKYKKVKKNSFTKIDFESFMEQKYILQQVPVSQYLYKRWIWMLFPWLAKDMNSNYSNIIKEYLASPIQYISVIEQKNLTKQALNIALQSKFKKQSILIKRMNSIQVLKDQLRLRKFGSIITQQRNTIPKKKNQNRFQVVQHQVAKSIIDNSQIRKDTSDFLSQRNLSKELSLMQNFIMSQQNSKKRSPFLTQPKYQLMVRSLNKYSGTRNDKNLNFQFKKSNIEDKLKLLRLETTVNEYRRQYDSFRFKNKYLAHKYKQLKTLYKIESGKSEQEELNKMQRKIQKMEQKIQDQNKNIEQSQIRKRRLQIILRVCEQSYLRNILWVKPCNLFLNNLKKMIKYQKKQIEAYQQNINRYHKKINEFLINFQKDYNENLEILKNLKLKQKLQTQFSMKQERINHNKHQQRRDRRSLELSMIKKNKTKIINQQEKKKLLQLENIIINYDQQANKFPIPIQEFLYSNIYHDLKQKIERRNQLNVQIIQKSIQLQNMLGSKKNVMIENLKYQQMQFMSYKEQKRDIQIQEYVSLFKEFEKLYILKSNLIIFMNRVEFHLQKMVEKESKQMTDQIRVECLKKLIDNKLQQ